MKYIDYYYDSYDLFNECLKLYYFSLYIYFIFKITQDNRFKKLRLNIKTFNRKVILRCYQTGFG